MDDDRIKAAVLGMLERSLDAGALGSVIRAASAPSSLLPEHEDPRKDVQGGRSLGTQKLLTRIVLGDILDDAILSARPSDRTFPLRVFFGELGGALAKDDGDGPAAQAAEHAFALASGLNFFFRAAMDREAKMRVGLEVSRALYAFTSSARMDADVVSRAAPLLAALMSTDLERLVFESVDHTKVFDSELHERTEGSDPTAFSIVRPASFLCRVASNNAIKAKAQVVT